MNAFTNMAGNIIRLGRIGLLVILAVGAGTLSGCMDITGRGPAPLAQTIAADRTASHLRAGRVYCMRGWLGIFSTGMDDLADKINHEVTSISVADEEWWRLKDFLLKQKKAGKLNEPLVLVGHSWGADDQIRVAAELAAAGIPVDLLITIDPVTPPFIPPNVKRCINIYKSHPVTDAVPFWRGVAIAQSNTKVPVKNIDLREQKVGFDTETIDHINIEKNPGVHDLVLREIRNVCPLRTARLDSNMRAGEVVSGLPAPISAR